MTEKSRFESRADFARRLNCKRSYVTALAAAGRLVLDESGAKVDWQASMERIEATRDPSKAATVARHAAARTPTAPVVPDEAQDAPESPESEPEAPNTDYQMWRARREKANALAAERDLAQSLRALLPADDVRAAISEAGTLLRQQLESLPDRLAPQLMGIADETKIRALLTDEIEGALREIAMRLGGVAE